MGAGKPKFCRTGGRLGDSWKSWCCILESKGSLEEEFLLSRGPSIFFLSLPTTDGMRPTDIMKGNLLPFEVCWFKCESRLINTFTVTFRLSFDQISRYHGRAKLTQRAGHQTNHPSVFGSGARIWLCPLTSGVELEQEQSLACRGTLSLWVPSWDFKKMSCCWFNLWKLYMPNYNLIENFFHMTCYLKLSMSSYRKTKT